MAFLSIEHPKKMNQGLLFKIENRLKNVLSLDIQTIIGENKGTLTMGYDGKKLVICVMHNETMNVVHIPIITQEEE